jgi:hypothetical protein
MSSADLAFATIVMEMHGVGERYEGAVSQVMLMMRKVLPRGFAIMTMMEFQGG